jgi:hypothetical protein
VSVPVAIDRLRAETERFGPAAFLLTVSDGCHPHAVAVTPSWDGDTLVIAEPGRRTTANAVERPDAVSLVWWPYEDHGYSLIVDGEAAVVGDGASLRITPLKAVLHRAASTPGHVGPTGCESDCVQLH